MPQTFPLPFLPLPPPCAPFSSLDDDDDDDDDDEDDDDDLSVTASLFLCRALPSNQISTLGTLGNAYYSNLQNLNLSYNPFGTDSLLDFNKFALLTSLDLSGCQLTTDHFLQKIDLPNMLYLNVSNNKLSGPLPDSLANMVTLAYLDVSVNLLQGTISPSFGGMSNLTTLATSGTSLACPDSYTSCGVPQNMSSAFCHSCPNFCSTCDQSKPFPVGAIIGIVVGAVVVIALFALALYYFFFRRGRCEALVSSKAAAQVCQEYSLAAVVKSTNGWSEANLLGAGAYGDVYRAVSPTDGTTPWAVKRAKIITNDFDTEVCEMATKHHPNLVRLLGFSIGITDKTRVEQILIYELMPNGDLSHWIGKEAATPLSFEQRLHVLVGAARGFEYLHSFPIIHRDIKPANILLDQNMQAKISDFGLVRKGDGNSAQSTRVVGTPGYVDPSYSASNRATTATDVYSFGIVILEVMTGRQAIEESLAIVSDEEATQSKNILASVTQQLAQSGDVLGPGLKDPRMDAQDDLVLKVLQLALRCTAKRSATRPGMGVIAAELEGVLAELIGSKRNAAAEEVDKQILDLTPSADIEKQLARLDAAFDDSEGAV
ncbi:unnamed protein product [Closterium sp. NIES-53]